MTQSIIVYRNPAEAAFWESGIAFPLMAALFVGFVVFLCTASVTDRIMRKQRIRGRWYQTQMWVCAILAIAAGIATFWFMHI